MAAVTASGADIGSAVGGAAEIIAVFTAGLGLYIIGMTASGAGRVDVEVDCCEGREAVEGGRGAGACCWLVVGGGRCCGGCKNIGHVKKKVRLV